MKFQKWCAMKKKTIELLDGKKITVLLPETSADVEQLRDMEENNDIDDRESLADTLTGEEE